MTKNLWIKTLLIIVVLLAFLYGIFGLPQKLSGEGLKAGILERIHLGLDLKGGTHLILQVMVNDAVNADSDQVIERLKDDLRQKNISYAEISKPDSAANPDRIVIKGIGPNNSSNLKTIVDERLPEYTLSQGVEGSYVLAMKQQSLTQLKSRAVEQAIETI